MLKKLLSMALVIISLLTVCSCTYYVTEDENGNKKVILEDLKTYTVKFVGPNNEYIATKYLVAENSDLTSTAPTPPAIEGYTFVKWESSNPEISLDNITGDVTFTAKYQINTYTVTFKSKDNEYIIDIIENVEYGSDLSNKISPPKKAFLKFTGWQSDKEKVEITNITDNVTFTATYKFFVIYYCDIAVDWVKNLFTKSN